MLSKTATALERSPIRYQIAAVSESYRRSHFDLNYVEDVAQLLIFVVMNEQLGIIEVQVKQRKEVAGNQIRSLIWPKRGFRVARGTTPLSPSVAMKLLNRSGYVVTLQNMAKIAIIALKG